MPEVKKQRFTYNYLSEQQPVPTQGAPVVDVEDEESADVLGALKGSAEATKKDISSIKTKSDEINKVLSVTKDSIKRNYLTTQLKKQKDDAAYKTKLLKNLEASVKKQSETSNQNTAAEDSTQINMALSTPIPGAASTLNMEHMKKLRKKISKVIKEGIGVQKPAMAAKRPMPKANPVGSDMNMAMSEPVQPARKDFKVVFDKKLGKPWEVLFTERGFLVNGTTRLSFENIEMAIHKNFNITLEGGQGLVLDQVKLNKIMKYKDKA